MKRHVQYVAFAISAFLFMSAPAHSESKEEPLKPLEATGLRIQAMGAVMIQDMVINRIGVICGPFESEMQYNLSEVASAWKQRNGRYTMAAYGFLHWVAYIIERQQGKQEADKAVAKLEDKIVKRSKHSIEALFKNGKGNPKYCQMLVARMSNNELDLLNAIGKELIEPMNELLEFDMAMRRQATTRADQ